MLYGVNLICHYVQTRAVNMIHTTAWASVTSSMTSGSSSLLLFAQESGQPGFCRGLPPGGGGYTAGKVCACNFQLLEWGIVVAANPSTGLCAELPETLLISPMLCGDEMSLDGRLIRPRGSSRVHSTDWSRMSANTSIANLAITTIF